MYAIRSYYGFIDKAKKLVEAWVNIFVLDTAHGYQKNMIEAIKLFRKELWSELILIAWNLMTSAWVEDIIKAWANWVKVWIWPGAMCTTRITSYNVCYTKLLRSEPTPLCDSFNLGHDEFV